MNRVLFSTPSEPGLGAMLDINIVNPSLAAHASTKVLNWPVAWAFENMENPYRVTHNTQNWLIDLALEADRSGMRIMHDLNIYYS